MGQSTRGAKKKSFWTNEPVENQTLHRAMSFPPPQGWVLVSVSAYGLKWYKLRKWLVNHFKNEGDRFQERQTTTFSSSTLRIYSQRMSCYPSINCARQASTMKGDSTVELNTVQTRILRSPYLHHIQTQKLDGKSAGSLAKEGCYFSVSGRSLEMVGHSDRGGL
ncbi:uncharacterized protein LY79DRAFT_334087 [Colletotrichum navitas]|uniref:Uncharacterized protein n=1 Tax=Colletotrichum navitas TaxID=681940 RepID=A0AAD8V2H7_9PEZI|nr:uncharacterized protein LY79DRAFT_334087 [Colletotrichum navitas]KAK1579743.1 hypothetical protein LY79DRAFT_334087 [Colletotrichum navitas]